MSEILNKPLTLYQANRRITELEQQLEQYHAVETWGQYFTMSDLEVHNLEQQISALTFALENITKPEDIYCRRKELRNQAAKA